MLCTLLFGSIDFSGIFKGCLSTCSESQWGNWAADEFELQVFLYGAILCDNVEEEEEGRKLQITVGICRRRQKKRNICAVEIASCATLLCFEIETLQFVLHKLVAGVNRLLPFHSYNLIRT